ncbi:MAG: hypothetical protein LLF98_11165 [Clostridium sp.]|uniref:hypothetical protein n=1 Tax=Clostridium sp. TaxID=1506 RepID=UPI0025C25649|nr:hypothetical protein [Clostridium sp.]MCE5221789.1 hypothetical protein [Clostridium sp.]
MKETFEIASAVLISLGGGGAIVFALSSWLGKVWANRILEKEKKTYQLEIESYKSQLSISLNKINSINERTLHISKVQYDKEFDIYQDIWEKLHDCIVATLNLYPTFENVPINDDKKEELAEKKYHDYAEKYNLYSRTIDRYAPFYRDDLYQSFVLIRNSCSKMGVIFKRYNFDIKYSLSYALVKNKEMSPEEGEEVYIRIPKELADKRNELQTKIHEYLKKLQVF